MRISVDGFNIAMPHGTGIATYGVELAATLASMGHAVEGVFGLKVPVDPSLREAAFFGAFQRQIDPKARTSRWQRRREFVRSFGSSRPLDVPLTGEVEKSGFSGRFPAFTRLVSSDHLFERAFTRFGLTGRFVTLDIPNPPDVMHWTYPLPVKLRGARNIYTLHDLVPLKLPYTTLDNTALYGRVVACCVAEAAQLCTVSEASKRDILERYAIDESRVTNTYQTAPAASVRAEQEDARAIEGVFGLAHRGYFLYFGAIEPKKNIGRLVEAYLSLQSETPLVVVGARAWQGDEELKLVPGGGAAGGAGTFVGHRGQTIVRFDYLPRPLLVQLVRGARAVVFPSLYEGFGLPVLEAMQLGTPVITSTTSSLPEVAGEAAILVDPYDVGAIAAAMARLDADPQAAAAMAARGLQQATLFAPDRYRERLADLYARAMRAGA